jgi:RimJ/RimL family protein N-acetyltransferase
VLAEAHAENQPSLRLLKKAAFVGLGGYWRIWKGGGAVWFERYALVCPSSADLPVPRQGRFTAL